jgi:hypothetical protein
VLGQIANLSLKFRGQYQRWANSRSQSLMNCTQATGTASPAAPPSSRFTPSEAPTSALADALGRLEAGCALAQKHLMDLEVCSPDSFSELREFNSSATGMFQQGTACLSSGIRPTDHAGCPLVPLDNAQARSDTLAYFDQFFGEAGAAAYHAFGAGNGLLVASLGLVEAGNAAQLAGDATAAEGLLAGAGGLATFANALVADGSDLLRIAALSRQWEADVTIEFNAESRAQLEQKETRERASSTGSGPASSGMGTGSGRPVPAASTAPAPAAESSTAPAAPVGLIPPSSTGPEPGATSAATRTRPMGLWGLFRSLMGCPATPREL